MNQKIKVLILDNSTGMTGAFRSIHSLVSSLGNSFEFIFVTPVKHLAASLYLPFLEIQKSWRLLVYFPMLLINSFKVNRITNAHKIDILHVNDLYNMVGVLLKIIKPELKVVYHIRLLPGSYASMLYNTWVRLVFRYADGVVCVSQAVFNALPKSGKKILIYDALPLPQLNHEIIKNDCFTFLYPANFIRGKGHGYALDAFILSLSELGDAQLVFVGGDLGKKKNRQFLNELKQQTEAHRLNDRVIFYGATEDTEEHYRSAHVVLNFSESESFSMTCLESLLFGTPVIATRCGGPEEIIHHGVNGLLVENRNVKAMADAMVALFQDSALCEEMAKQSVKVASKFSILESSKKMSDLYRSLLE